MAATRVASGCRRECAVTYGAQISSTFSSHNTQLEETYCLSLPDSGSGFSSELSKWSCAAWLPTAMGSTHFPHLWPLTRAHPDHDWEDSLIFKRKSILGRRSRDYFWKQDLPQVTALQWHCSQPACSKGSWGQTVWVKGRGRNLVKHAKCMVSMCVSYSSCQLCIPPALYPHTNEMAIPQGKKKTRGR